MNIWGLSEQQLREFGALHTAAEIYGQPLLWLKVYEKIKEETSAIQNFLDEVLMSDRLQIVLTGAGTSSFIGLSLHGVFVRQLKRNISTVATTDLVTHPLDYLSPDCPVLIVSFARSGNSPESIAAVTLADQVCSRVFHLIITCDQAGALANYRSASKKYVFVLPEESNDKSLAMTGSYSGMLLAGLLIAHLKDIISIQEQVHILMDYANRLLNDYASDFKSLADLDFKRAVFLGSGPLFGTATESHLKLQELTDGRVICKNDSFLGFRHGPKAVIDATTLVFFLFSNKPYVAQYEKDLADAIVKDKKALCIAGLQEKEMLSTGTDKDFILSAAENNLQEDFLPVCSIIPAQMLGFFKSLQMGLCPDSPSVSGSISRVVQGVIIYPYKVLAL
jgi:tagatose-6-phosphate ketose/aldose isomerase